MLRTNEGIRPEIALFEETTKWKRSFRVNNSLRIYWRVSISIDKHWKGFYEHHWLFSDFLVNYSYKW